MNKHLKAYQFDSLLRPGNKFYDQAIQQHLVLSLKADLGEYGDITTAALSKSSNKVQAVLLAKDSGILAGMQEILYFLNKLNKQGSKKLFGKMKISKTLKDGVFLKSGTVLAVLEGAASDILKLERTILNFLQHMSGVATLAHEYTMKCKKYPVLVCTTRKTPWGLLDKRAAVVGGAGTHRLNLSDAILVKDTHLDLIQHDFKLLSKKLLAAQHVGRFIEIEVESLQDAWKAIAVFKDLQQTFKIPNVIMLDNVTPAKIEKFVRELKTVDSNSSKKILVEASGGITLKNIEKYAQAGADIISVGAITHSAPALDISLKIKPVHS